MITGDEDLIIVEFGVNDTPGELINRSLAVLLYSLLNRPKRPAVLILDLYSPILDSWYGAGVGINVLGEYFDVPVIRSVACLAHQHRV